MDLVTRGSTRALATALLGLGFTGCLHLSSEVERPRLTTCAALGEPEEAIAAGANLDGDFLLTPGLLHAPDDGQWHIWFRTEVEQAHYFQSCADGQEDGWSFDCSRRGPEAPTAPRVALDRDHDTLLTYTYRYTRSHPTIDAMPDPGVYMLRSAAGTGLSWHHLGSTRKQLGLAWAEADGVYWWLEDAGVSGPLTHGESADVAKPALAGTVDKPFVLAISGQRGSQLVAWSEPQPNQQAHDLGVSADEFAVAEVSADAWILVTALWGARVELWDLRRGAARPFEVTPIAGPWGLDGSGFAGRPRIVPVAGGHAAGWTTGASTFILLLDSAGRPRGDPVEIPLAEAGPNVALAARSDGLALGLAWIGTGDALSPEQDVYFRHVPCAP